MGDKAENSLFSHLKSFINSKQGNFSKLILFSSRKIHLNSIQDTWIHAIKHGFLADTSIVPNSGIIQKRIIPKWSTKSEKQSYN